jgi:hypothetical protein
VNHFLSAADLTRERALSLFRVTGELKQRRAASARRCTAARWP